MEKKSQFLYHTAYKKSTFMIFYSYQTDLAAETGLLLSGKAGQGANFGGDDRLGPCVLSSEQR